MILNCCALGVIFNNRERGRCVNIGQMKTVLREIISKTDLTPCVVGHRGVGKSAAIIQVCSEMGWRYVSLRLGQMEVGDLVGIPYRENDTMYWSRPSWWPGDDDPPTIVHCDELNRAQQEDTLQAIFQFVEPPVEGLPRALHTHRLAPQHKVVVTINPPDGTYQVATLDRALIDRMVIISIESDYACWAKYASQKCFDDAVRQFLNSNTSMLSRQGSTMSLQVEPTERAWEMVSILRCNCHFSNDLAIEIYAGVIGEETAILFMRWLSDNQHRPLMADEILSSFGELRERAIKQRDDLQAVTMNDLIITTGSIISLEKYQEENLVAYIEILPRDLRFGFVKSLLKIPVIATMLSQDKYDAVIFDAIRTISAEAE